MKGLLNQNTLAFYYGMLLAKNNVDKIEPPGACTIKLFTAVIVAVS